MIISTIIKSFNQLRLNLVNLFLENLIHHSPIREKHFMDIYGRFAKRQGLSAVPQYPLAVQNNLMLDHQAYE